MKIFMFLFVFVSVIIGCTSDSQQNLNQNKEFDIKPYLKKLDSVGLDISQDTLLFQIGYQNIYFGHNERGNALIEFAFSKMDSIVADDYRHWSVQNTKNGNYSKAIKLLETAMAMNPKETSRYYGWVLLYYYRDYEKALEVLEQYDNYTPDFSDAPMGEDVHYLKGLCLMQLKQYKLAINEFDLYIDNLRETHGEEFIDVYTFVQKGRCLSKISEFKKAIKAYETAINYYENCTEAYYFLGQTQIDLNMTQAACTNFKTALKLIQSGRKSADSYVEYFHEIYPQQIEKSILDYCD